MRRRISARRAYSGRPLTIKRKDIDPPAIYRKLYRPLGAVAFAFADLEGQLSSTLNVLIGRRGGSALDDLMQSFTARVKLFYFLAEQLADERVPTKGIGIINWPTSKGGPELKRSARALHSCLLAANNDRNDLFHSPWDGLSPLDFSYSKTRLSVSDGKFAEKMLNGITPQLLDEEADYLLSVAWRLADWRERARYWDEPDLWPASLPNTLPQRSPLQILLHARKSHALH